MSLKNLWQIHTIQIFPEPFLCVWPILGTWVTNNSPSPALPWLTVQWGRQTHLQTLRIQSVQRWEEGAYKGRWAQLGQSGRASWRKRWMSWDLKDKKVWSRSRVIKVLQREAQGAERVQKNLQQMEEYKPNNTSKFQIFTRALSDNHIFQDWPRGLVSSWWVMEQRRVSDGSSCQSLPGPALLWELHGSSSSRLYSAQFQSQRCQPALSSLLGVQVSSQGHRKPDRCRLESWLPYKRDVWFLSPSVLIYMTGWSSLFHVLLCGLNTVRSLCSQPHSVSHVPLRKKPSPPQALHSAAPFSLWPCLSSPLLPSLTLHQPHWPPCCSSNISQSPALWPLH